MVRFFRKIRQHFFLENNFSKYLLYALGEIFLVVIGILIALQIDTFSDQKKERQQEKKLLYNLSQEVGLDIQQITYNTQLSNERLGRLDSLILSIKKPDSVNPIQFIQDSYEFVFDQYFKSNSGIFDEAVSSGKMSYIQNEVLRQSVFNYYRNAKETYTDGTTRQITDEFITPLLIEQVYLNQEGLTLLGLDVADFSLLQNLDIKGLAQSKDFWKMALLKFGGNKEQILRWDIIKQRAEELKQQIDTELESL